MSIDITQMAAFIVLCLTRKSRSTHTHVQSFSHKNKHTENPVKATTIARSNLISTSRKEKQSISGIPFENFSFFLSFLSVKRYTAINIVI